LLTQSLRPFNVDVISWQKGFSCLKCKIISVLFPWYLQTLVSRISRNRVFRLPKFGKFAHKKLDTRGKFAHTKLGTFETWISRLGKIAFSDIENEGNFHSLLGTLKRWIHESAKKNNFRCSKCEKFAHTKFGTLEPWVSRLGKILIF